MAFEDLIIQQLARATDLPVWAADADAAGAAQRMSDRAAESYVAAWPDAELLTFTSSGVRFWYDAIGDTDMTKREGRPVIGWGQVPPTAGPRDKTRQGGHPLARHLVDRGFDKAHLIPRASGGGMDVNLYPQAWQVNQGRSPEGKEFRRLERLGKANSRALMMTRLIFTDDSIIPAVVHLIVAVPGISPRQGLFLNDPIPRPPRLPRRSRI